MIHVSLGQNKRISEEILQNTVFFCKKRKDKSQDL